MVNVSNAKQVINLFVHNPTQRLVQKPKVVQMAVEDLSKLNYAPACDTFASTTPKLTSKIAPLRKFGYGWGGIAKSEDGKIIGEYKCSIDVNTLECDAKLYPKSWIMPELGLAKSSLHVDYMDTRHAMHQGYGREMMKRFYLKSLEEGCEGRISLTSAWESGGFYKKFGFEVGENELGFYRRIINEMKKTLEKLYTKKQKGENIAEIDSSIESVKKDIEEWTKWMNDPIGSSGGSQHLFFTPTPENVAKLFCK